MKNELKFRGKSTMTDNEEIVYGNGCYTDKNDRYFILVDDQIGDMRPIQVEKIENFINLEDKYGKKIYKGDIIKIKLKGDSLYAGSYSKYKRDFK